jgi:hypothetical protein
MQLAPLAPRAVDLGENVDSFGTYLHGKVGRCPPRPRK